MHLHPLHLLLLSLPASSSLPSPVSQRENCTLTPPGTANACDCTQASFSSWSWSLSDLYFHSSVVFSTPAHQIDGGWVSFGLTSQATADVAFECDASSTQLQDWFYGNQWYTCTANSAAGATAQFRFDRMTGRVDVNQSWTCDDDPVYPTSFQASGSGNVSLSCNETKYQNANWTSGQIYSTDIVECAKVNLTIMPSEISAVS